MGQKQRLRAERRRIGDQNLSVKFSVADDDNEEGGIEIDLNDLDLGQPAQAADSDQTQDDVIEDDPPVQAAAEDDPLAVLQRQYDEVKASKEAAERRASEEAQRARDIEARLQATAKEREESDAKAQERIQEHEATLRERAAAVFANQKTALQHAYASEDLKLANAKRTYAEALRAGDFDAAAEANTAIASVTQTMRDYTNRYHGLEAEERALAAEAEERTKVPPRKESAAEIQPQAPQPQQQGDQFEAALANMHPNVAAWVREHKDDVLKPERQKLAFAADAMALAKGYTAGSDQYLDFLDEHMGYLEPGTDPDPVPAPAPKQNGRRVASPAKRPTAAPGSRASASGSSTKVFLTKWDQEQAKLLGYTEEQYARDFKQRAAQDQLAPSQTNGRLMARYTAETA